MKADKWLEVNLVGLVILGGLMFVTTKIMNLNTALGQVQANLAATSERVDHLLQALPAIATRVAQEQVTRPLHTIVVVTAPVRSGNTYQVNVNVIDTRAGQKWTAPLQLATQTDAAPLAELIWTGYQLDETFASFSRMVGYARTVALDPALPAGINADASFVLGNTSAHDYLAAVHRPGFNPKASPFTLKLTGWKDLTEALKAHPQDFR